MLESGRNVMDGEESKKINDITKKKFDEEEDEYRFMKDEEDRSQTLENEIDFMKERKSRI